MWGDLLTAISRRVSDLLPKRAEIAATASIAAKQAASIGRAM
jgi:hypothetical protein